MFIVEVAILSTKNNYVFVLDVQNMKKVITVNGSLEDMIFLKTKNLAITSQIFLKLVSGNDSCFIVKYVCTSINQVSHLAITNSKARAIISKPNLSSPHLM